jgi:hypothetical protein
MLLSLDRTVISPLREQTAAFDGGLSVTVTADVGEILALLWHDLWCNLFYNYSAA